MFNVDDYAMFVHLRLAGVKGLKHGEGLGWEVNAVIPWMSELVMSIWL